MLLALLLVACSASPAPGQSDPVASATAPPASSPSASEPPAPTTSAFASASAAPAGPSACPEGMLLVDGSYCPELEVKCLEQFYAESNHLWVCLKVQEPTQCLSPTEKEVPMRYCVDKYEFPNRVGERPMVMQNFYQAQVHCAKAGKRVCTEHEWTLACEGPSRKPFPYGYVRDASEVQRRSQVGQPRHEEGRGPRSRSELARLWKGKVPSGSSARLRERRTAWPTCPATPTRSWRARRPSRATSEAATTTACTPAAPGTNGVRNQCRPKIYTHDEGFYVLLPLSFRCCAEPDGKPTDPRTPKQIERGWTFEKVRHIAEHSWKLPLNPKWPGDPGYVSGGPK
jgi:sulfatase modifying factor 1